MDEAVVGLRRRHWFAVVVAGCAVVIVAFYATVVLVWQSRAVGRLTPAGVNGATRTEPTTDGR